MFFVSLYLLAFLSAFAGQVLAQTPRFNITVGDRNLTTSQILVIPDSPVKTFCATNCTDTTNKITACGTDPACLCRADTVASLLRCETCMLHYLINTNTASPDFRAGSVPVLGGYAGACAEFNITLAANQTQLGLPASWDGPMSVELPVGMGVVYAIFGGILGVGAMYILSNLE